MPPAQPHTPLSFYRSLSGREPVREWLKALPIEDRRAVGLDLMRVQFRWPVGLSACRYAVPWVRVFGKCDRPCQVSALPA